MNVYDGGTAFPLAFPDSASDNYYAQYGMTLRDHFAVQALANLDLQAHIERPAAAALARSAYNIADAMLLERAKDNP